MLCLVDADLLDYAKQLVSREEEPSLVANQEFRDICQTVLGNSQFPCTTEGCLAAYLMVVEKITSVMSRDLIHTPSTFAEANEMYEALINGIREE